jgi:hypothetical protein
MESGKVNMIRLRERFNIDAGNRKPAANSTKNLDEESRLKMINDALKKCYKSQTRSLAHFVCNACSQPIFTPVQIKQF